MLTNRFKKPNTNVPGLSINPFSRYFLAANPVLLILLKIICDEGHILKNTASALNIAINKIQTRRRIILTGKNAPDPFTV